jgi:hypothetical protein
MFLLELYPTNIFITFIHLSLFQLTIKFGVHQRYEQNLLAI